MSRGQPLALRALFLTEMWERFSYYGMRALLVLYLVNRLGYSRENALSLYATYTGLVYLAPVIGGYLSDRYLGHRKAIVLGATVMMLGHFAMAVPSLLYLALGLLICGNGFFKPTITSFLGGFYEAHDERRDGGFTFFYMGINLGAFLSPLVAGTLGETWGWDWGFASAGLGMALGLLQFLAGQARFEGRGYPPGQHAWRPIDALHVLLLTLGVVLFVLAILALSPRVSPLLAPIPLAIQVLIPGMVIAILLHNVHRHDGAEARDRVLAILVLCGFVILFWMGFEQAGGTMNLFADQKTDRVLMGYLIPAAYFQAINPLAILLFGPLFSVLWSTLDRSRFRLSTPVKMALGMVILGLGFVVLYWADKVAAVEGTVSPLWLIAVYVLHTWGELCLSPIGLSMVTQLAPIRLGALVMGLWFIANGVANYLAGHLEGLLASAHVPLYGFLVASSVGAGLLLLLVSPLLKRWMHGRA